MKRYIYQLPEEDFYEFLLKYPFGVEVLKRNGEITFATYEPVGELVPLKVEEVKTDWQNWKENFKPVEVEDFVILPPWKRPIFIKPGMAFGTGLHPTTQLCIRAIKEHLQEGWSVLDVGTGSGILAIVSKILGASKVLGIDVSEEAVRECRENAELNGVEIECIKAQPKEISGEFDLVVANLEIKIFEEVLKDILPKVRKVGIFSGLYREEDLKRFSKLLNEPLAKVYEQEDWFCVVVMYN